MMADPKKHPKRWECRNLPYLWDAFVNLLSTEVFSAKTHERYFLWDGR
jgi:hypothetical protein